MLLRAFRHPICTSPSDPNNEATNDRARQPQAFAALAPLFRYWLELAHQDERHWKFPTDEPKVEVKGRDPVRILLVGDAPAAGYGVRTHHLGIAGHLARRVSHLSQRGAIVAVSAEPTASAHSTLRSMAEVSNERYDAVVLMLTTTDGLRLTGRRKWIRIMAQLICALKAAHDSPVHVTSTADLFAIERLRPIQRRWAGAHAKALTDDLRLSCSEMKLPVILLEPASELVSNTYATWANSIAKSLTRTLIGAPMPTPTEPIRLVAQRYTRRDVVAA